MSSLPTKPSAYEFRRRLVHLQEILIFGKMQLLATDVAAIRPPILFAQGNSPSTLYELFLAVHSQKILSQLLLTRLEREIGNEISILLGPSSPCPPPYIPMPPRLTMIARVDQKPR